MEDLLFRQLIQGNFSIGHHTVQPQHNRHLAHPLTTFRPPVAATGCHMQKFLPILRFSTLEAICREMDCQPGDILEYQPDPEEKEIQIYKTPFPFLSVPLTTLPLTGKQYHSRKGSEWIKSHQRKNKFRSKHIQSAYNLLESFRYYQA